MEEEVVGGEGVLGSWANFSPYKQGLREFLTEAPLVLFITFYCIYYCATCASIVIFSILPSAGFFVYKIIKTNKDRIKAKEEKRKQKMEKKKK